VEVNQDVKRVTSHAHINALILIFHVNCKLVIQRSTIYPEVACAGKHAPTLSAASGAPAGHVGEIPVI